MDLQSQDIENYVLAHTEEESDILKAIDRDTHLKTRMPRMMSGHLQGKLLGFLAGIANANNIVEIGSYTGYSAIAMAEATSDNCQIHCIEINEELAEFLKSNIQKSNFRHRIHVYIGNAIDIIPTLIFVPDFVFLDADKANYLNYYQLLINLLPSGGIIIADNVLWSGKVAHKEMKQDSEAKALMKFNDFIQADGRVSNLLLPIRDGLMLIKKH